MKTLSIVHVIDILNTGGAERVLITLANLQYEHGHKVKVITIVGEGPLRTQLNQGITYGCMNRKWKWNPFVMKNLVAEIKDFDIIHVHSSHNLRYVFLAGSIFRLSKPLFFHEHFGDIHINQKVSWHQRFIYPKTIFIGVSRQLSEWGIHQFHINPEFVFVLPNIILKQVAVAITPNPDSVKQIVMVSNFRPTKNLFFALTLFENLQTTNCDDYHLTLIGKIADIKCYQELTELIDEKGLQKKVSLIHDCDDIQSLLGGFNLALHTSLSESGPLVLIEYLAQQLPFVAYNTGEVAAQIKNDLPECFVNSFSMEEWINKIEYHLCADKSILQSKLNTVFEKYFSAETYYNKCISIYNAGLLNAKKS